MGGGGMVAGAPADGDGSCGSTCQGCKAAVGTGDGLQGGFPGS